ncbi:uncharacterized protein LOC128636396 [Bombina bombina]|uniref:uncharacterized protein LOC128636396 n=1 Tax=Bombina bombina TaxID=8345 RepID=UPI00235A8BF9|nr:uncharacterized protein LOC128636396 [Bombina bombina]
MADSSRKGRMVQATGAQEVGRNTNVSMLSPQSTEKEVCPPERAQQQEPTEVPSSNAGENVVVEETTPVRELETGAAKQVAATGAASGDQGAKQADWQRIEGIEELVEKALAPSTWAVYRKYWGQWCKHREEAKGGEEGRFLEWLMALRREGVKKGRLSAVLAGISYCSQLYGGIDWSRKFIVKKIARAWGRGEEKEVDKREPITEVRLQKMIGALEGVCANRDEALIFRTAFLVAFHGAMRIGELLPKNRKIVKGGVETGDVRCGEEAVLILVRRSKTDKEGKGAWLNMAKTGGTLCPVACVKEYLIARRKGGRTFLRHADGSDVTIFQFKSILQRVVKKLGWKEAHIAPHSFRIGAATAAAGRGCSEAQIKKLGRWKSAAYKSYIRVQKE